MSGETSQIIIHRKSTMARKESVQRKLQRVRAPRVQLTYDVEIGDAIEKKELPFVAGVIGDFAGQSQKVEGKLKERRFVQIDADNFDDVLHGVAPRCSFHVPNRLDAEGGRLCIDLQFNSMQDFHPESIVRQVEPLRKLLDARAKLSDLRNKMAGSDRFEDLLGEVLSNTEKRNRIGRESGRGEG
jgi:type VI secretion system protein ImpB